MKRFLIVLFVISLLPLTGFTQPSQGSIAIGGNFNLQFRTIKNTANNNTVEGPKYSYFNLTPSVEYFLTQNISVGLGLGYAFSKVSDIPPNFNEEIKSSMINIVPFSRIYIEMGEKVNVFGQASLGIGFGKQKDETTVGNLTTTNKTDYFEFELGIRPGFQYSLSSKLAIEATFGFIGYQSSSSEMNNVENTDNSFQLNLSSSTLTFGIKYFLK